MLINHSIEREILLRERSVDGKRWVICYNKKKADDDKASRDTMIKRSKQELEKVKEGCGKRNLKTKEQVYHAAYKVIEKHCTKRFIEIEINKRGSPRLKFQLKDDEMKKACRLDGKYILETSNFELKEIEIVQAYIDRDTVEKFFLTSKSIVELRPIYVYTEQHVKAHVFICTLALMMLSAKKDTQRGRERYDVNQGTGHTRQH